ncbi:MAG TPA: hypothetical protein ENK96_09715 [Desulfobulbaceae bacterium]|nr:hypothetical protein [Desulfobulbaceae bacterium]
MGLSEKIMEALRAGILLNEKISTLIDKVDRMDRDVRHINDRLIRLETMVEIAQAGQTGKQERRQVES